MRYRTNHAREIDGQRIRWNREGKFINILLLFRYLTFVIQEILGTAQSVGCTVDGKHPHSVIEMIDDGEVDLPEVSYHLELFLVLLLLITRH